MSEGIGKSVPRKEDNRFITGKGRYTDDIKQVGQSHAYFVRSPHAHADVVSIDVEEALSAPGVIAVLTGADVTADGLGGLPCGWMIHSKDGSEMKQPHHPVLADKRVHYLGEPVAMVIADTALEAKNASELVVVDWAEKQAVVSVSEAQAAPAIYDDIPQNTCYEWALGDSDAVEKAMEKAAHVTRIELTNNRLIPNAMEPRAALAEYNPGSDELTLHTTSQNPHLARLILTAFVQIAPEHKLRVIAPDVGGGFGSKILFTRRDGACLGCQKIGVDDQVDCGKK